MLSFQKIITGLLVFCVILFFYLHIQFHLKTCNDLEVYEIEDVSKERLEEICDLRQPILYDTRGEMDTIVNTTNKSYLVENYPIFEIKSKIAFPMEQTFVPMMKRKILTFIFQVANAELMKSFDSSPKV